MHCLAPAICKQTAASTIVAYLVHKQVHNLDVNLALSTTLTWSVSAAAAAFTSTLP
jgi:hypothetical protein